MKLHWKMLTVCAGYTNKRKDQIHTVYIRSEYTMQIGKIYVLIAHIRMKSHSNHADSKNMSAYADIQNL